MVRSVIQFFKQLFGGSSKVKFHTIKVKVTPRGAIPPSGEVFCDIDPISVGGGKVQNNRISLDAREGPFCIQFKLDNNLDWDNDPIWVQLDDCPDTSCSEPDQIWVEKTPRNKILTILNMNVGNPCELHYRLNFTGGRFCDPIMDNGGGNTFNRG